MKTLRSRGWLVGLLSLVVGCGISATDHPPPAQVSSPPTPTPESDASTAGDAASTPSDAEAGAGPSVPGKLDPERVYFFGYRTPRVGNGERVIIDPTSPATIWGGFGEDTNNYAVIRPDGRVLVAGKNASGVGGSLFVFEADYFKPLSTGGTAYPQTPLANDTVLDTSVCTGRPWSQRVFPDDGLAIHTCDAASIYYLQGSKTPFGLDWSTRTIAALGSGRTALLSHSGGLVVRKADGTEIDVPGLEPNTFNVKRVAAARFRNGSFSVALEQKATPGVLELGTVSLTAVYAKTGTYTLGSYTLLSDTKFKLDGQGVLFAILKPAADWEVTRFFTTGAAPAKVYDENGGKAEVKFWDGNANLISGG